MSNPLLRSFGDHLRGRREAAGLPLAELARRAGVSRRFLTEAEGGRANPSLLKLAQLAEALDLSLADLVGAAFARPRSERLALLGLRGAGKSSVGRELARALEVPFVELDERVERLAGMSLAEIFNLHGEQRFHRLEAEALEEVLGEGDRLVLATGGSIVVAPETFARLKRTCRSVWLRATPEEHFQRVLEQGDRRPMRDRPRAMQELRAILAERNSLYADCALAVETSARAVDEVAREILSWHLAPSGGSQSP